MSSTHDIVEEALEFLKSKGKILKLKREQELAINNLLSGNDVLAVLPTGFGKSIIFTIYCIAKNLGGVGGGASESRNKTSIIVISPLKSIIADQLEEINTISSATELTAESVKTIIRDPPNFIYCSAEQVLTKDFLEALKDSEGKLHQRVACIVIDESHILETWTGKRKGNKKFSVPFREAYGRLSILRSLCKQGVPLLAITGTADQQTQKTIVKELSMDKNMIHVFVSPNRKNLKFTVYKVKKSHIMNQLSWLISEIKKKGSSTPQTIIFCNTLKDIATIANWMLMKLGDAAFCPNNSRRRDKCLLGIYHSLTVEGSKNRLMKCLKEGGTTRIVLATTALSMGVNFPSIRRVIMFGPPRTILDFHQEAGRAGRDDKLSEVILYYHGQQSIQCEPEVKDFLREEGCIRVAAYMSLDKEVTPLEPGHQCCSTCALECRCGGDDCILPMQINNTDAQDTGNKRSREVSQEDRVLLHDALREIKGDMMHPILAFHDCHGFSEELIKDVVDNCDKLFTLEDIIEYIPVFSTNHAVLILELVHDVFGDCEDVTCNAAFEEVCCPSNSCDIGYLLDCGYENDVQEINLDVL